MATSPARIVPTSSPAMDLVRPAMALLLLTCLFLVGCVTTDWTERDRRVLWQHAQSAAARFSQALPDDKGFHHQAHFGTLQVNVVSRERLAQEVEKRGGDPQRVTGFAEGGFLSTQAPHQIWVVGGKGWVDQWALGHELAHVLGFDVDNMRLE